MSKFNFVDATEIVSRRRRHPVLDEFAEALRSRPGDWAEWPLPVTSAYASTVAHRISNNHKNGPKLFRDGFEGASKSGKLYVRYVGGDA